MQTKQLLIELGSLPVDKLMEMISNRSDHSENAEAALQEFLHRYSKVLKAKCRYAAGILSKKSNTVLNLVYDHAVELVYYQAGTYKPCGTGLTPKEANHYVAGWLAVIAEVAAGQVGEHEAVFYRNHVVSGEMEAYSDIPAPDEADEEPGTEAIYREFLKRKRLMNLEVVTGQLKPVEQDIVNAFTHPMAGKKYLDAGQIAAICRKWKISQDNLYQIKHRSLDKIRKGMLALEESGE